MKRLGGLWPDLVSFENLHLAICKARRGMRQRPDVARFELGLERNLLALQLALQEGSYRPAPTASSPSTSANRGSSQPPAFATGWCTTR
jgi:hypothetical protein